MKKVVPIKSLFIGLLTAACSVAMAAETLFSNKALNVNETGKTGSLWVFSRGDNYSGVTLLTLDTGATGVRVVDSKQGQMSDSKTATQDGIFSDVLAEHRRTPSVYAGKQIGYVMPMFGLDDNGNFLQPAGIYKITDVDNPIETPLEVFDEMEKLDSAMYYAVSGFAYDSSAKTLWMARGAAGLGSYDVSNGIKKSLYVLNLKTGNLDSAKSNYKWNSDANPSVFDVKQHPETGDLWLATSKGLWIRSKDGKLSKASTALDTSARVTGLWMGGNPLKIVAETSYMGKEATVKGALWQRSADAKDFAKVDFLDTAGKKQKKDVYDDGNFTVSGVAFLGNVAYVAVIASGGSVSGYFKLEPKGIRAWETNDDGRSQWLYGYATGVTDRDAIITSICSFPLKENVAGLAVATYGNGISVSADSGASWSTILNRARLGNNLSSIRMVPSVITAGDQALVSYKVGRESKITIDVFSYDMRKVRTIVKDVPRSADASRSTNPKEDFWDGYDSYGRPCTMGVYYVRVKDNHGHVGWGKVMTVGGHK